MANLTVNALHPYVDWSKRESYETEEEGRKTLRGRLVRWADERVFWNSGTQRVEFQGFPYWYNVKQDAFADELSTLIRSYMETTNRKLTHHLENEMARFVSKFGVDVVQIDVPGSVSEFFTVSFGFKYNPFSAVVCEGRPARLFSSDEDGRFMPLNGEDFKPLLEVALLEV